MTENWLHAAMTLIAFNTVPACATMAEERDKPLILELNLQSGSASLRQEVLVTEDQPFRVVTREGMGRWVVRGDVKRVDDRVVLVNLNVGVHGPGGFSVSTYGDPVKLTVDEFKGGGGGTRHLGISDLWIRRGVDAIPILIKQLSAEPDRSAAAAYYLSELGEEARRAIPALKEAANDDNEQTKDAARHALDRIEECTHIHAK